MGVKDRGVVTKWEIVTVIQGGDVVLRLLLFSQRQDLHRRVRRA